jgi:hypothetical protein
LLRKVVVATGLGTPTGASKKLHFRCAALPAAASLGSSATSHLPPTHARSALPAGSTPPRTRTALKVPAQSPRAQRVQWTRSRHLPGAQPAPRARSRSSQTERRARPAACRSATTGSKSTGPPPHTSRTRAQGTPVCRR